jgi:hypothetical protein
MLTLSSRVRPKEVEIAAKVIDGEAVIINLTNGMYYSMDQVGGMIWAMVTEGSSLREIVSAVTRRYDVSPGQAQVDVERLAAELLEQKLVRLTDDEAPPSDSRDVEPLQKLPYESPVLNKYSDLGDLLALDPPMPGLDDVPWEEPSRGSSP